jgi:hypothetical protein
VGTLNVVSVSRIANTVTTGSSGNIATNYVNDGRTVVFGAHVSGMNIAVKEWVSINNGGYWYLTVYDPNTGATKNNESVQIRYFVMRIRNSS